MRRMSPRLGTGSASVFVADSWHRALCLTGNQSCIISSSYMRPFSCDTKESCSSVTTRWKRHWQSEWHALKPDCQCHPSRSNRPAKPSSDSSSTKSPTPSVPNPRIDRTKELLDLGLLDQCRKHLEQRGKPSCVMETLGVKAR